MTAFATLVEQRLQLAGLPFDRGDLISFLEANRVGVDCEPDAGEWAIRFAAYVRGASSSGGRMALAYEAHH